MIFSFKTQTSRTNLKTQDVITNDSTILKIGLQRFCLLKFLHSLSFVIYLDSLGNKSFKNFSNYLKF